MAKNLNYEYITQKLQEIGYDLQGPNVNFSVYVGNGRDFLINITDNRGMIKFSKVAERDKVDMALCRIDALLRSENCTISRFETGKKSFLGAPEYCIEFFK